MWKIRRKANPQNESAGQSDSLPDVTSPRIFCRAVLCQMWFIHKWHPKLVDACAVLPADQQKIYEEFVGAVLRPSFDEVLHLINRAQQLGVITDDEAASLRAGQAIQIALPEASVAALRGEGA